MKRLPDCEAYVSGQKCFIFKDELEILDYALANRYSTEFDKNKGHKKYPKPRNLAGLHWFLGLDQIFMGFIKDVSVIASSPIYWG